MLVSHRKEFIYTKTVKTAGTSVESYFEKYCMPEGEWSEEHSRDVCVSDAGIIGFRGSNRPKEIEWFHHMPASRIKDQIGDEIWNRYFKFCVIRDPFDKAVSAFYHFKKAREAGGADARKKTLKQKISEFFSPPVKFNSVAEEFEHWLSEGNMGVDRDKYTIDGEFCVDYVIRYEALSEGLQEVCEKIGIEYEPDRLPTFKKGMRDEKVGLYDIYTPKAIEIVSDVFAYELEKFGYEPPKLN
ncbi:MAG: sulfotransferase family 2 domain-containing protein [Verrucomicrobiales bacterium]|nr:sulfotransferase family 2 domain-containing protein [Verrucomicrobiales bacterium]